jgi:hypothetical protein
MAIETKLHETHPATHAKAAPKHPMTDKANALLEKIAKADERHREEVKKLREEAADLYAEAQAENLSPHNQLLFNSVQTSVDSALNCLDPDCLATAPEKAPEAAKKAE